MSLFHRYGIPLLSTLVALLGVKLLQSHVDPSLQPAFLLAVAVSAACGGRPAGLLATLLGSVAAVWLLSSSIEPEHRAAEAIAVRLGFFVPVGVLISELYERLHRDIAARKEVEEALRESEESLARAQRIAHVGNWDWNVATSKLSWSAEIYRIFGIEPWAFGATYDAFLEFVHPDDRERVREEVRLAVEAGKPYAIDHRVVRPDGSERIVHEEGEVERDEAGNPLRMCGTVQDVTEARLGTRALAAANAALLRAEVEKRLFNREVLRSVTNNRFHLVEADDIPVEGRVMFVHHVGAPGECTTCRKDVEAVARQSEMAPSFVADLALAVGEATSNALRHGGGGFCVGYLASDRIIVRVADQGSGISTMELPASVLLPGHSSAISLGMGFKIMLQLMDRIWVATGPDGTIVQLEKWLHPQPAEIAFEEVLERLGTASAVDRALRPRSDCISTASRTPCR